MGVPLIAGSVGGLTVSDIDCAAEEPLGLVATTENVVVAMEPAMPLITPALLSVAQAGNAPAVTTHPPDGIAWEAVRVCEKFAAGDVNKVAALLMTGATTLIVTG